MKSSIALASYNGAAHIEAQLNSFAQQTCLPDELIICDDGSTDETVTICRRFAAEAPFVVQVHQNEKNLGYMRNFEKALSLCTGDIVFMSDQDDVWLNNKIEAMIAVFENDRKVQLLIHDIHYCDDTLQRIGQTKIGRLSSFADPKHSYVTGMATAVRTRFLRLCLPFPLLSEVSHDRWLHACAASIGRKRMLHAVLADYRRHGANATSRGNINLPVKTTFLRFFVARMGKSSVESLSYSCNTMTNVLHWMTRNRDSLIREILCSEDEFEQAKLSLLTKINVAQKRLRLLSKPKYRRLTDVALLYYQKGYHGVSGLKSALKDLFLN